MLAEHYPVALVCDVLNCARSSYYHQAEPADETKLRAAIEAVVAQWPTYGYRRVTPRWGYLTPAEFEAQWRREHEPRASI